MNNTVAYTLAVRDKYSSAFAQFNAKINTMSAKVGKFGKGMNKLGNDLKNKVTLPLMVAGGVALKYGYDFDMAMNSVEAKLIASSKNIIDDMAKIERQARMLGATTQFSASEVGKMQEYLAGAGWDAPQILAGTKSVLDFAAATKMSGDEAARVGTNILGAYGITATETKKVNEVFDTFAGTLAVTKAQSDLLAETFKYVAPVGKDANMSIQQLGAVSGILATAGIVGSQAGTSFRRMLIAIQTGSSKFKKMGINVKDANGELRSVPDILSELGSKLDNVTGVKRAEILNKFFGLLGVTGASVLTTNAEKVKTLTEQLKKMEGMTGKAADVMMGRGIGSFKLLASMFEALNLEVYKSGLNEFIRILAVGLGKLTLWFIGLSPATKKFIVVLGMIAAILPIVMVAAGGLLTIIPFMSTGLVALGISAGAVSAGFTAIGTSLVFMTGGLILLIPLLVAVLMYWKDIKKWKQDASKVKEYGSTSQASARLEAYSKQAGVTAPSGISSPRLDAMRMAEKMKQQQQEKMQGEINIGVRATGAEVRATQVRSSSNLRLGVVAQ